MLTKRVLGKRQQLVTLVLSCRLCPRARAGVAESCLSVVRGQFCSPPQAMQKAWSSGLVERPENRLGWAALCAKASEGKDGPVSIVLGARAELMPGREGSHPPWRGPGTNTGIAGNNAESTGFAPGTRGSRPTYCPCLSVSGCEMGRGHPPACSEAWAGGWHMARWGWGSWLAGRPGWDCALGWSGQWAGRLCLPLQPGHV